MNDSNPTEAGLETIQESSSPSADENDPFKTVIAILIAVVAVAGAVVAWRAALAGGQAGDADFAGAQATINAVETHIVTITTLYENYRAFLAFTHHRQLAELLDQAVEEADEAELDSLEHDQAVAWQLASDNEFYFAKRYLNEDGTYNSQRDLGEAWAEAGQKLDLNPQPHFAEADRFRDKANLLIAIFIVQAFALLLYTVAEGLHPGRNGLRYLMAAAGSLFLIFSLIATVLVEWT